MVEFGTVIQVGRSMFLAVSHVPHPKGRELTVPQIFGPYMRAHSVRNCNQVLHGDQTRCEENFYTICLRQLTFLFFMRFELSVKL